ncbi:MAG TPA: GPR endopeptidase [Ruminococcaceae bacterium]|nr:GPR endopeptidase [Oscillospiraceae bacterium]
MEPRTDLALEKREILGKKEPEGVESSEFSEGGVSFTKIKIINKKGSEILGKPIGTYITAEIPQLMKNPINDEETIEAIANQLRNLIPKNGAVLVAGLGNTDITPDAVGPKSVSMVLATRHIDKSLSEEIGLGELRSVAGFIPGVLGRTGLEAAESVKGIAASIEPSAVIVVDALAARRLSRLGTTVQISDTGIIPGSGVGNARKEITERSVGVPVISVGVPTVVDVGTLVNDLTGSKSELSEENRNMIITPREIDIVIERASELIGMAINKALQPDISVDEMMMLVGN